MTRREERGVAMMQQEFANRSRATGAERAGWGRTGAPATSMTLLADITGDSRYARWREFVERYRPMMEAYLGAKGLGGSDREDVIQETFAAVAKRLPDYRYCPGERARSTTT